MSYALNGVNFVDQPFTPSSDCAIWRRAVSDGILDGMAISAAGSSLTVQPGWLMAGGKELQLPAAITVPVTEATSGKARLVVNVDLTKTATELSFLQAWIELEYEASYADLTQQDLSASGTIYQMILAEVSLSAGGISAITRTCGPAHGRAAGILVELPAADWSGNSQTVRVDGVHADSNIVVTYAPAYKSEWLSSDIDCTAQGEGTLTFTAAAAPTSLVKANVLLC